MNRFPVHIQGGGVVVEHSDVVVGGVRRGSGEPFSRLPDRETGITLPFHGGGDHLVVVGRTAEKQAIACIASGVVIPAVIPHFQQFPERRHVGCSRREFIIDFVVLNHFHFQVSALVVDLRQSVGGIHEQCRGDYKHVGCFKGMDILVCHTPCGFHAPGNTGGIECHVFTVSCRRCEEGVRSFKFEPYLGWVDRVSDIPYDCGFRAPFHLDVGCGRKGEIEIQLIFVKTQQAGIEHFDIVEGCGVDRSGIRVFNGEVKLFSG